MIDVRLLRTDPEATRVPRWPAAVSPSVLDQLDRAIAFDALSRDIVAKRDAIRAEVNELSKQVGQLRRSGDVAGAEAAAAPQPRRSATTSACWPTSSTSCRAICATCCCASPTCRIPTRPTAPAMSTTRSSRVRSTCRPSSPTHRRVPHWETATALGILDNERATKISGAMFTMQRGDGATLARALCQYALDRNVDAFEEIRPPSLVTTATLTATGQLPKFADDAYNIERDDLWCIPTAEVPLTLDLRRRGDRRRASCRCG